MTSCATVWSLMFLHVLNSYGFIVVKQAWCLHEHFPLCFCSENCQIAFWYLWTNHWISLKTVVSDVSAAACTNMQEFDIVSLPVGWAVGSLAGATQRGRRKESQSEHHRAVIPLDDEVRAARPDSDSDNILRLHAVQQNGGLRRRKKLSNNSPPLTWKTTTNIRKIQSELSNQERYGCSSWDSNPDLNQIEHAIRKKTLKEIEHSTGSALGSAHMLPYFDLTFHTDFKD